MPRISRTSAPRAIWRAMPKSHSLISQLGKGAVRSKFWGYKKKRINAFIQDWITVLSTTTFKSKWAISYWWRKARPPRTCRKKRTTSSSSGISSRSKTLCSSPPSALRIKINNLFIYTKILTTAVKEIRGKCKNNNQWTYNCRIRTVSPIVS